jgi:hypothetical protein
VIEWQNTVFSRKEKFSSVTLADKTIDALIWSERGGIPVKFLHSRTTVNSARYIESPRSICSSPYFVYFTQYMSEILLSHYKAMPHVSMHTIETITDFGWTVFSYLPCYYDLPSSDFHHWYLKRQLTRTSL